MNNKESEMRKKNETWKPIGSENSIEKQKQKQYMEKLKPEKLKKTKTRKVYTVIMKKC